MGRPCRLCADPRAPEIDAKLRAGESARIVAEAFGYSEAATRRHMVHLGKAAISIPLAPTSPAPEMPDMVGRTPREQAELTVKWLQDRINFLQANGGPSAELLGLAARMTAATNLLAKLSGAFDVTHTTIMNSKPWEELMGVIRGVWAKHPAALRDLVTALQEYQNSKSGPL